jgi:mono/diheme cytochrome c family protein
LSPCPEMKGLRMCNRLLGYAAIAFAATATTLAFAADLHQGETLAKEWCASCHLVEPGQKGSTTEATPFATFARRRGVNGATIAFYLLDPHPNMPNIQ